MLCIAILFIGVLFVGMLFLGMEEWVSPSTCLLWRVSPSTYLLGPEGSTEQRDSAALNPKP